MFLAANLAALRPRDPELARRIDDACADPRVQIEPARSGGVTLRVDGRLESGRERPEADGSALARSFVARADQTGALRMVVFGMGVHTLASLGFPGDVLVVEPSLAVCRAVFEHVDLRAALSRVSLVVGEDVETVLRHPVFRSRERGVLVFHPATRRRAPELFDELALRFRAGGSSASLDIAVVPPLYGGSLPVARATAAALRQLGHRVRYMDLERFLPAYEAISAHTADARLGVAGARLRGALVRMIGDMLVAGFELDPPDVVFALAQAPLDETSLQLLGRRGIARAFWFCEDFHVMSYWSGLAGAYDVFFHVQPDDFAEPLRSAGGYGVPLPMGFDPELHRPIALAPADRARYAADVSFLGAGYHNRVQFLPALFSLGLKVWGTDWPRSKAFIPFMPEPNARQSSEASNKIFNASRINLNLHSSPWCDGVNPAGDYLNPRTFELAGAGAFQLVDERRDLAAAFKPGEEVESFRDLDECRDKIRYFLDHPEEAAEIAEGGRRRALAEHTYRHRMEVAVDALRDGPVPIGRREGRERTAGQVARAAREEFPGLAAVLARLDEDAALDSEAISTALASGEGDLTRDEKLLIYMREARAEMRVVERGASA